MTKQEKLHKLFADICLRFAQESHCESRKVCTIAVKNNRIIATGINGTAKGAINCDEYFRNLYNERNYPFTYEEWKKTKEWRAEHHAWSNLHEIHAEQSLICECAREGISLKDADIYITLEPCTTCAKLLLALKPKNIYFINEYDKSTKAYVENMKNCGINIKQL